MTAPGPATASGDPHDPPAPPGRRRRLAGLGSRRCVYDGTTCLVDHENPQFRQVRPAPVDRPFFVCLTQALGITTNSFVAGTTPLPATTSVDWVRVWGPPA